MLNILSRQFATRLSLGASPIAQARRTFLTSSPAAFAAAAKKPSTTTKTTKRPATTKAKSSTKKDADGNDNGDKKKKKKKKDVHVVLHKEDKPPRLPPNAYACFVKNVAQGVKSPEDAVQAVSAASVKWKALPEDEKQKYVGQAELLRQQYEKDLASYWKTVDPVIIKEINRRRAEQGKYKLKVPRALDPNPRPLTPFFRFLADFRTTAEGRAVLEANGGDARAATIARSKVGAAKWKDMSDAEKGPYVEAYEKEKKIFHANKEE
ncbi:hypothetical protein CONPUDRAFT_169175 [Coniophora puteana RWD-64-598 SS2]|uniref:HMG box domain-containing protein n=1 Tax=Coniophora puteana (strain RWD-64-598) TaxID=741705 RepID=A0A5M3MBD8_CONPW|nr:uncharacterized protein CONPUDRAFT_169175 [Coniophora puteana RWD-64-598 SS2]EIW75941.1 hypothetical protein CONPUDRAFT_169175 [Coniophora puteana RWD-64-598 SS2]